MAKHNDEKVQNYLTQTVYPGAASPDLTTNISRRLRELLGEMTARLKSIYVSAGGKN